MTIIKARKRKNLHFKADRKKNVFLVIKGRKKRRLREGKIKLCCWRVSK